MDILNKIIARKKIEVAALKRRTTIKELKEGPFFQMETLSLRDFLLRKDKTGIIAEFKRKSPSKGIINNSSKVQEVTSAYAKFGASGISVLTDQDFFGGSMQDLKDATINKVPLLRKDFIIDEYQVYESKSWGAGVILLIAACLSKNQVKQLATVAKNLGLNVLLEIHNERELGHICNEVDVVGVNNRDLKSFVVDINCSIGLSGKIPGGKVKISESGIDSVATIRLLQECGFNGFLVGEKFMKEKNPGQAFQNFTKELKEKL
jgi:indole-3-glycerol phosphate synthase